MGDYKSLKCPKHKVYYLDERRIYI